MKERTERVSGPPLTDFQRQFSHMITENDRNTSLTCFSLMFSPGASAASRDLLLVSSPVVRFLAA